MLFKTGYAIDLYNIQTVELQYKIEYLEYELKSYIKPIKKKIKMDSNEKFANIENIKKAQDEVTRIEARKQQLAQGQNIYKINPNINQSADAFFRRWLV